MESRFYKLVFTFCIFFNGEYKSCGDSRLNSQTTMSGDPPSNALIPYNTAHILSHFYVEKKNLTFPNLSRSFEIKQDWSNNGVAGVVWEAALVLGKFLTMNVKLQDKSVLELGAGTGLVSMVAAAMGANVTATDLKTALPLLRENIELNYPKQPGKNMAQLRVKELEWGKLHNFENCFYDYVFGADIIYLEESFDALIKTLHHFSKSNSNLTKIILSQKLRYDRVEKFLRKLETVFLTVKLVYQDFDSSIVIYECY